MGEPPSAHASIPIDEILAAVDEERDDRYSAALMALVEKYVPADQWRAHLEAWYEQSAVPRSVWEARLRAS